MFFSRYFSGSRNCSATSRRRPARWRAAATSGSSKTSISTCAPLSTSAGKPTSDCAPRFSSISSGSSPKVQAV
jgi:hypothetical protein